MVFLDKKRCKNILFLRRKHKELTRKEWNKVTCACAVHCRGVKSILLHIGRRLACLRRVQNMDEHQGAMENADGHVWTPPFTPALEEFKYPHDLVQLFCDRLLHALQQGLLSMRFVWRVHILVKNVNSGRVRPGRDDHVLTSHEVRNPMVLHVEKTVQLRGDLDSVARDFPREIADASTWIAGRMYRWNPGDITLVKTPFLGGRARMRLPVVTITRQCNAVPLVHVAEPVLVDHRCVSQLMR